MTLSHCLRFLSRPINLTLSLPIAKVHGLVLSTDDHWIGTIIEAWWHQQWVHNWRQWITLSLNLSMAKQWEIGPQSPSPIHVWRADTPTLVQTQCRHQYMLHIFFIVMALRFPRDGISIFCGSYISFEGMSYSGLGSHHPFSAPCIAISLCIPTIPWR